MYIYNNAIFCLIIGIFLNRKPYYTCSVLLIILAYTIIYLSGLYTCNIFSFLVLRYSQNIHYTLICIRAEEKSFQQQKYVNQKLTVCSVLTKKTIPNFIFLLTYIQKEMVNLNDIYKVQTSNTISLSEHFCLTFNNKYKRFACINGY